MTTARHSLTVTQSYVLHGTVESYGPARGSHISWPCHNLFVKLDRTAADAPQSAVFVRASPALLEAAGILPGMRVTIRCHSAVETYPGKPLHFDMSYLLASSIECN